MKRTITVNLGDVQVRSHNRNDAILNVRSGDVIKYTLTFDIAANIMERLSENEYAQIVRQEAEAEARSLYRRTRITP